MEQKPKPTEKELRSILRSLKVSDADTARITAFTSSEDGAEYAVWRIGFCRPDQTKNRCEAVFSFLYSVKCSDAVI